MKQDPPSDSEQQQRSQQTKKIPKPPNHPNATKTEAISTDPIRAKQEELEERIRRGERWLIYLTAAIAFFGLCSVIVAILQWRVMSGQLAEMKSSSADTKDLAQAAKDQAGSTRILAEAAIKQATAADNIASAAKRSVEVTQDNIILDQRARVGASGTIYRNFSAGSQGTFGFVVVNSGRTPALGVQSSTATRAFPRGSKFSPIYAEPLSKQESKGVFHPGVPFEITTKSPGTRGFTQAEIDNFKRGEIVMYLYAEITYQDIFKRSHYTRLCVFMEQDLLTTKGCDTYNDAN
jgi:hypothetical protein